MTKQIDYAKNGNIARSTIPCRQWQWWQILRAAHTLHFTHAQFRSSQNHWWNTCSSHASICFQCHEGLRVAEDEGDVVKPEAIIWPSTQVWCCNNPRCTNTIMKLTELAWDQLLLCTSGYLWLNRMQHCIHYGMHTYIIHRHRLYKHTVTALLQNMWLRLHRGTITASQRIAPSDDTLESREIIHRPGSLPVSLCNPTGITAHVPVHTSHWWKQNEPKLSCAGTTQLLPTLGKPALVNVNHPWNKATSILLQCSKGCMSGENIHNASFVVKASKRVPATKTAFWTIVFPSCCSFWTGFVLQNAKMHQKKASFFLHLSFILGVPMEFVVATKVPKPSDDKKKRDSFQLHLNEARITTTFWITPC